MKSRFQRTPVREGFPYRGEGASAEGGAWREGGAQRPGGDWPSPRKLSL